MLLAFPLGMNGVGIWLGLSAGLGVVAVLLLRRWMGSERLISERMPTGQR